MFRIRCLFWCSTSLCRKACRFLRSEAPVTSWTYGRATRQGSAHAQTPVQKRHRSMSGTGRLQFQGECRQKRCGGQGNKKDPNGVVVLQDSTNPARRRFFGPTRHLRVRARPSCVLSNCWPIQHTGVDRKVSIEILTQVVIQCDWTELPGQATVNPFWNVATYFDPMSRQHPFWMIRGRKQG